RDELAAARAPLAEARLAVSYEERVDLQAGERLDALAEPRRVVHHLLAQQRGAAGRVADDRVADDEEATGGVIERHLARRLARHADDGERTDTLACAELGIDDGALAPGVGGVRRVDRDGRAGLLAHQVGLPD